MPRRPEIKLTHDGQRPLFATLPDDVMNDLNEFCFKRDIKRRDELLEHVLRQFLGTPRKPPKRAQSTAERVASDGSSTIKQARSEIDALDVARRHAEAIVDVTSIGRRRKRTA